MEFFDKLGKKASEAYKVTADKTGKIAKEAKLKMKMSELKSQVKDIYIEIGKKVYEKHVIDENIDIKKDLEEECTKIDVLCGEIDGILKECMDLKDKKMCQNCHKEIDKDMNFCPECGAKQEEEQPRNVEIIQKLENTDIPSEVDSDAENIDLKIDSVQQDSQIQEEQESEVKDITSEDSEENLEKTVTIESDIEEKEKEE